MYELRDKQTPYWFINDEVSCIQESLGAAYSLCAQQWQKVAPVEGNIVP